MVSQAVKIKDKKRGLKRFLKISGISLIMLILGFTIYYTINNIFHENEKIILENPLKDIVLKYSQQGILNEDNYNKVVDEAVLNFNEDYINYILVGLGINNLHKSPTFENPLIELVLEDTWNSEIKKGVPYTEKGEIDNEDIRVVISKQEAVNALLSEDIEEFMKNSVVNGNTRIEMIANKAELYSKGYLTMYNEITGEELE